MFYLLPIFAAVLWAVCFAFMEEGLESISVATLIFCFGVAGMATALMIPALGGEGLDFKPLFNKRIFMILLVAVLSAKIAEIAVSYALKDISASYVAFMEATYPLFVPIAVYLFFGHNQINSGTVIGGLVIMVGVYILLTGQQAGDKKDEAKLAVATVHQEQEHQKDNLIAALDLVEDDAVRAEMIVAREEARGEYPPEDRM